MPVSQLQRDALATSDSFRSQVAGLVLEQALYLDGLYADMDSTNRNILAGVVKAPNSYGFERTMVSDNAWDVTYDQWATDPNAQKAVMEGFIQKHWTLLTGYNYVPPQQTLIASPKENADGEIPVLTVTEPPPQ